jgi:hypothetical protein
MRKPIITFILVSVAAAALASDIAVKATVTTGLVALGTAMPYTITVSGVQNLQPPVLPPMDGFDVRYSGPATRVSVINNSYEVEQSFNYILIPLKEGKFTIPAVTVDVKGQALTTEPIPVEVVPAGAATSSSPDAASKAQDIESRLKLLMGLARDKVYVGEAVPLTVRMYVNHLSIQELSFPEIAQDGFRLEPFTEPKQFQEVLDGVNWQVVEFSTLLYPAKPGEIRVAPGMVRGSLLFKAESPRDTAGGIFDDGFFGNFFSSYQKRPLTLTSNAAKIDVLPLPEEGKPADFSGAVGEFDLKVEASPIEVKSGDPVTLRMILTGVGNMKAVSLPVFKADGFKVYDPQIKDEAGRRVLEQVIIPTDTKVSEVPALKFSYFDTRSGNYRTIERGPFPLKVAPPASGEEFQAMGFSRPAAVALPETLGRDIVFIKDSPGRLAQRSGGITGRIVFYAMIAIYLQAWVGGLVFYLRRRKMTEDPKFARQVASAREARRRFQLAAERLAGGDAKGFYDALENGLRQYFVSRLGVLPGDMDMASVDKALMGARVDGKHAAGMRDIFKAAEHARFAGMSAGESDMRTHLALAEDMVRAVERRLR